MSATATAPKKTQKPAAPPKGKPDKAPAAPKKTEKSATAPKAKPANPKAKLTMPETPKEPKRPARSSKAFYASLADTVKHFSDKTRLELLDILAAEAPISVTALCDRMQSGQPAVSHHLAMMRHVRIVVAKRDGKSNFYELSPIGRKMMAALKGVVNEGGEVVGGDDDAE